jgi:hypothetical protein
MFITGSRHTVIQPRAKRGTRVRGNRVAGAEDRSDHIAGGEVYRCHQFAQVAGKDGGHRQERREGRAPGIGNDDFVGSGNENHLTQSGEDHQYVRDLVENHVSDPAPREKRQVDEEQQSGQNDPEGLAGQREREADERPQVPDSAPYAAPAVAAIEEDREEQERGKERILEPRDPRQGFHVNRMDRE